MSNNLKATLYAMLAAAISAFGIEIANGSIALPGGYLWIVPIVVAVIAILTPALETEAQTLERQMQTAPPLPPDVPLAKQLSDPQLPVKSDPVKAPVPSADQVPVPSANDPPLQINGG